MILAACGGEPAPIRPEPEPSPVVEEPPPVEAAPVEELPPPEPLPEPSLPELGELRFPAGAAVEGGPFTHAALLEALAEADHRQFKPVGSSSVVFRMKMRSDHMAAFRPRSRGHPRGHLHEVAAYRVSLVLGFDNVAPATLRRVRFVDLRNRLHPRYNDFQTQEALEDELPRLRGWVVGASIYWVPDLHDPHLDEAPRLPEWTAWLQHDAEIPEGREALARDLSNMVLFDFVTGNFDRFSGSNLNSLPDESRLVLRDHNIAFGPNFSRRGRERLEAELRRSERFSRATVERLATLDRASLQAVTALELPSAEELAAAREVEPAAPAEAAPPGGFPFDEEALLTEEQLDALLERVRVVRSYVGSLIEAYGEEAVLPFP